MDPAGTELGGQAWDDCGRVAVLDSEPATSGLESIVQRSQMSPQRGQAHGPSPFPQTWLHYEERCHSIGSDRRCRPGRVVAQPKIAAEPDKRIHDSILGTFSRLTTAR